jgi:GWxTD domain-containing protein
MRTKLAAIAAVLLMATIAEAGLSKKAQEWRNGPERWLMTSEEQKAWKALQSDAEAVTFIDLFWARRDPTPNTARNEFREEFQTRVKYADAKFAEKRYRGALTERGQVFIVLGPADGAESNNMYVSGPSGMSSASGRQGDHMIWRYPREKAVAFGMPKLEVAFVQQAGLDNYVRDVRSGQFANALPAILKSLIVNPGLTAVPEWAAPVGSDALGVASAPRPAVTPTGRLGRVLLLADLGPVDLGAATDPFATLQGVEELAADADLAYVIEYCGSDADLKVDVSVNDISSSSELAASPLKAVAGCGAVPGMMSLSGLTAGTHEVAIVVTEANGGKSSTKKRIRIK